MDGATIRAVEASIYAAGYPVDAEAILLIELDGLAAGMDADTARVEAMCQEAGARTIRIVAWGRFREAREAVQLLCMYILQSSSYRESWYEVSLSLPGPLLESNTHCICRGRRANPRHAGDETSR